MGWNLGKGFVSIAFVALASCSTEPEVVSTQAADPYADRLAAASPVTLPPSIAASRTYRCRDNSLLYADFYTDNSVRVGLAAGSKSLRLVAAEAQGPFNDDQGHSLSGNSDRITYIDPDRGTLSCKA